MKKYIDFLIKILLSIKSYNFSLFIDECPNCHCKRPFVEAGIENHLTKCLFCHSSIISLSLIRALKNHKESIKYKRTYELSFHGAVFDYLKSKSEYFYFSEYFQLSNDSYIDGIRNEDIQKLTFLSNFFDLVTSTEVLEHVPNYKKGLKEVYRVLDRGGYFFFTVPLYDFSKTKQIAKLNKYKKIIWIGVPEFHGSRKNGPNSVPVFWHHSRLQILKDLKEIGFSQAYIEDINLHGRKSQPIVVCRK